MENTVELQERLFVEGDEIQIGNADPSLLEAIVNGITGEGGIVFFPGESLFLGSGNDLAILDEARGAVVIKGGEPENVHGQLAFRAMGQHTLEEPLAALRFKL